MIIPPEYASAWTLPADWLIDETRLVPLRPERNPKSHKRDLRWQIVINEKVEPDL